MKTYKDLDVYQEAFDLFVRVHPFSLKLPKHELYELGSQLRRASDSVISNIVEGYGRRSYKSDFVKFLIYAHASNLEVINHLEKIAMLYPEFKNDAKELCDRYDALGAKLFKFIEYVKNNWKT